jgi:branched-chain amino acid aminotransferase
MLYPFSKQEAHLFLSQPPLPMRCVIINGQPAPPETAAISVYDRGFLYGDSVFETIRTYGGKPFALAEHLARLARSAERVFIPVPVPLETFAAEVEQATSLAANPESYIRVMLTRGTGPMGLDPDLAEAPNRIVFVEPLVAPPPEAYANGIDVILVRTARTTDDTPAAGAKVANYLTSLLALREARRRGAVEAFIVDGRGRVLEGTTSNVFLVKAGKLVTAPEESGILAGITRAYLLGAADRLGIGVDLRDILETELSDADEVFISSSIREVLPVVRIEGKAVGGGAPGPLTRRLHDAFRRQVTGAG